MLLTIYTDGGARGNPGPAASAAVLYDGKKKVAERGEYLGVATNNEAEYRAVIIGLEEAKKHGADTIHFFLDSLLVAEQLNGAYKIKDANLGKFFIKIWNAQQSFKKVTYTHIPREKNKEADALVNKTLDQRR
ncbi:MAG: ribonuclease HI family protein [Parcubacteria group bacterium]|nr:ribonuclease HI family protein [Parcubacteria group bacterium]